MPNCEAAALEQDGVGVGDGDETEAGGQLQLSANESTVRRRAIRSPKIYPVAVTCSCFLLPLSSTLLLSYSFSPSFGSLALF